jgi:hypothetical protein
MNSSKDASESKAQRATQGEQLAKALDWILDDESFDSVKLHGRVKWTVPHLMRVAILWVWSSKRLLVESANDAIEKTAEICQSSGIKSYQVMTNALIKYGAPILDRLQRRMHHLMEKTDNAKFRIGLWLVLAVDGSRLDTPRTRANEARFCKPKSTKQSKKKKRTKKKRGRHAKKRKPVSKKSHYDPQPVGPQVWLTLLWHVALRMPWAWKIGPSYSSERGHLMGMLETVNIPENTLFCGDAGFVGYEFWKSIDSAGHYFLCRVGSNCRFLKKLGKVRERDGIVYCWPLDQQRSKQPPLVLRLLCFNDGRGQVYLVTNELSTRRLSDAVAGQIYRRRWGIEVQIRSLKQTFDRSKLLGRTPDVAEAELNWSLMGLWVAQLFACREQTEVMEPDSQASVAQVLRIIEDIVQRPDQIPKRGRSMSSRLSRATTDTYQRAKPKKSRNYPRRKEEPRTGPPKVVLATKAQRELHHYTQVYGNAA